MRKFFLILAIGIGLGVQAQSPFTEGNIVVVRVGRPDTVLNNQSREVFLHEYSPSGALVQVIALPSSGNTPFALAGTSTTEGFLARSANGAYLTMGGYRLAPFVSSPSSSTTKADRIIARVGKNGIPNLETIIPDSILFRNLQLRGVVSLDGNQYWAAGGGNGIRFALHGADTSVVVADSITNNRNVAIFNNQLYLLHNSGTAGTRVMEVGTGLPQAPMVGVKSLPGLPLSGVGAAGLFMADLAEAVPGPDVLYLADDLNGLWKFSWVGDTAWKSNGKLGSGADAYRGLTGMVSGNTVTLYATRKGGSGSNGGGELVRIMDSRGYNDTLLVNPEILAIAETRTAFRGVALAPVANALGSVDTYVYTGTGGSWNDPANWRNGQVPPAELPAGFEIVINPSGDSEYVITAPQTIKDGAKFTIAPGKRVRIEGGLVME